MSSFMKRSFTEGKEHSMTPGENLRVTEWKATVCSTGRAQLRQKLQVKQL